MTQGPNITICHATPPATAAQGWNEQTVDQASILGEHGHDGHEKDIIPAFTGYAGKNLDESGVWKLAHHCNPDWGPIPGPAGFTCDGFWIDPTSVVQVTADSKVDVTIGNSQTVSYDVEATHRANFQYNDAQHAQLQVPGAHDIDVDATWNIGHGVSHFHGTVTCVEIPPTTTTTTQPPVVTTTTTTPTVIGPPSGPVTPAGPAQPVTTTTTTTTEHHAPLPFTGSNAPALIFGGGSIVMLGALLLAGARRKFGHAQRGL